MSKRRFRSTPRRAAADYPTYEVYDSGSSRRAFLARLGAIGAAVVGGSVLAACGDRAVGNHPDARVPTTTGGVAPSPDSRLPQPDAELPPDAGPPILGEPIMPDARIDDLQVSPGFAPMMDAQIDPKPKP